MRIQRIADKEQWDKWLARGLEHSPFSQSWGWGDILINEGKEVERLAAVEGGETVAEAQVVYGKLLFGWRYAFGPKGPVNVSSIKPQASSMLDCLVKYLKSKSIIFLRIEPPDLNTKYLILNTKKTIDLNPRATLFLDLTKSEEELLAGMHPKTRYNIRLAEKKGVTVENKKDEVLFLKLSEETCDRDGFRLHEKKHYHHIILSSLSYQLNACYQSEPIASAIFIGFGNTLTYLYGASANIHRNVMAPYLLQWEGIKLGKKLGYKWYDFFGVAPAEKSEIKVQRSKFDYCYDPAHQYAGVTRFKLGFGGAPHEDPGTYDLIIDRKKYRIYEVLRRLRRLF